MPVVVIGPPVMGAEVEIFVTVPPASGELIVMVSVKASVVMVMFAPATRVSVSVALSATTSLCPLTAMVLNASDALLLKAFQSVEDRYPSVEAPDWVMLMVPEVVIVPP